MPASLTFRDRAALVYRGIAGSMPTDMTAIGGRLLAGVIPAGGVPPSRGTKDFLAAYSTMPWLRAVVARISFDCASVDWVLYVKRKSKGKYIDPFQKAVRDPHVRRIQRGAELTRKQLVKAAVEAGDLEPVESHQLLDLLGNFNVFHTGLSGRRVTQQHLDLAGDAFWVIERDARGMPVYFYPVPPNWILGTPTVARPSFRVSFRGWQGTIPATEVVWFSDIDPSNPYGRGSGTAAALADELETDEYAAKHVKAFFFNRARPDLIVSPKSDDGGSSGMDESEVKRLEEGWTQRSGGFWRAFKPFFMRRAVEIKELDQNLRSQQFVQLREFQRNTCIQVFGVSPEILGIIAGSANRATITMAEYIYARRVLVPRLELQRAVIQERVVPEFDERLILDYVSPVGRDAEMELKAAALAPWALDVNEWRARMGESAMEGTEGDVHMSQGLVSPVSFDPEPDPMDLPMRPMPGQLPPAPGDETDAGDAEAASWDRFR